MQLIARGFLLLGMLYASACGNIGASLPSSPATCDSGAAAILVNDASLQILCGCDEAAGTLASAGSALTCTLPVNSTVNFIFAGGMRNLHQIESVGSPAFASSPIFDPSSEAPVRAHGVRFETLATYTYRDAINHAISGTIVTR
jgi:hypothetical protein